MAPAVTSPAGYLPAAVYLSTAFTGALLIGAFFAVALTGVLAHMSYVYFDRFPNDRPVFKAAVFAVLFVNIIHSAFVCVYEYQNLIDGFGNIATLTDLKWGITGSFTLSAFVAAIVQVFYAYRVHALLGRAIVLPVCVCIMALGGIVFSIYLTVRLDQIYVTFPTPWLVEALNWLYSVAFALPALADLVIVGAMVYGLLRTHKLELPSNSWKAIRKVIFYAIETNTVTTILCLISVAMFATARRPISFAICFNIPKMYGITLVSSLLARQSSHSGIKGDYEFDGSDSTSASSPGRRPSTAALYGLSPARQVRIATTTQTVVEKDGHLELVEHGGRRSNPVVVAPNGETRLEWGPATPKSVRDKDESIDDISALSYA